MSNDRDPFGPRPTKDDLRLMQGVEARRRSQNSPNETLAEAEDRLRGEISALTRNLASTSDPKERRRIAAQIDGSKAGLDAVLAEKGAGPLDISVKNRTLLEFVATFGFDQAIRLIFELIQNDLLKPYKKRYPEITPRIFFYAAVLWAGNEPEFHRDTEILEGLVKIRPDELRKLLNSELNSESGSNRNFSLMVSGEMIEVAEKAVLLAGETTGQKTILLRHLLVTTLTFRNPLDYLFFTQLRIESKRVVYGFLKYLREEYPSDNPKAWTKAFADISRLDGINLSLADLSSEEHEEDDENFDPVTLQVGSRYHMEPQVLQLIQKTLDFPSSSGLSHQFAQVTPVGLLLTAVIEGASGPQLHPDCYYLADFCLRSGEVKTDNLRKLLIEELFRAASDGTRKPQFSEAMEDAFRFAQELAVVTTGDQKICMRHLLSAFCLLMPGWGNKVSQVLENARLNINGIGAKLLNYIQQNYQADKVQAWKSEFAKVFPTTGRPKADKESPESEITIEGNQTNLKSWDAEFATLRRNSGFNWSTTLDRVLDLLWEEHSRAFKESLGGKDRFEPQISPRAFFLAALLHGARHQEDLRDRADDRGQTLIRVVRACELNESQIYGLLNQEFFRQMPPDRVSQDRAVISAELEAVILRADNIRKTFGSDPYIGTRHLFLAFLEAPKSGKTGDLIFREGDGFEMRALVSAFRDSVTDKLWVKKYDTAATWPAEVEKLEQSLPPRPPEGGKSSPKPSPIHFGSKDDWDRNAAESEAGLNVDDYAAALREVYTKAGAGEFSLAIFGHWGRGKTFLMNRLAKLLKAEKYESVFFSAWKYPTTPEVWVHLYETVADKVCSGYSLAVLPRIIRTGIARHGSWPILTALAGLAFSLTPKLQLAKLVGDALVGLARIIGLGGLIWLAFLAMGIRRTKAKLTHNYITATRHTDKLGLQATIGRDLKALLKGWMPVGREVAWIPWICYLAITGWISWSAWAWFGLSIEQKAGFSWLHITAPIAAFLMMGLLACWAIIPIYKPSRLLLVIDDLDRCNTGQLLHVIESVKLLTEEPEISKRLQVAALVDEDILEHAVLWKHKDLQKAHCSEKFNARRIIRENCEKLFTAHLRLPGLDHEELGEIFDLVIATDKEAKRVEIEKAAKGLQDAKAAVPSPIDTTMVKSDSYPSESSKGLLGRALPMTIPGNDNKDEVIAGEQKVKEAEQRLESLKAQGNTGEVPAQVNDQAKPAERESLLKVDFRFGENETEEIAHTVKRLSSGSSSGPWGPRASGHSCFVINLRECSRTVSVAMIGLRSAFVSFLSSLPNH